MTKRGREEVVLGIVEAVLASKQATSGIVQAYAFDSVALQLIAAYWPDCKVCGQFRPG